MKTKLHFLLVALLLESCIFSARAEQSSIIITRTETEEPVCHRAPAHVPITCFLEDNSYLVVNFLANLGSVSVEIANQTTCEYNQTTANALAGQMIFPISGTAGQWSITFTLTDGTIYQGTFNISF